MFSDDKIETATYHTTTYQHIQEVAQNHFNQEWSFLDALDGNFKNDMFNTYDTDCLQWLGTEEDETWNEWVENGPQTKTNSFESGGRTHSYDYLSTPHPMYMFYKLAEAGVIPKGKYLVQISW